jgi:hypothetical protein
MRIDKGVRVAAHVGVLALAVGEETGPVPQGSPAGLTLRRIGGLR